MSRPNPLLGWLLTAAVLVAAPATASARTYQGSISTPVLSADGSSVSAQVNLSAICDASAYCGFFPEVTTVTGGQPCAPLITGSTWVGTLTSRPYGSTIDPSITTTATWSEWPTLSSGPKRACLYARTDDVLVAQVDYLVPAPPAAPVYTPQPPVTYVPPVSVPAAISQSLSRSEAVTTMRRWLKQNYGHRWTRGHRRTVKCPVRSSNAQLGCYGVWIYRGSVLSKSAVITETEDAYLFSKSFASAPSQIGQPGDDIPSGSDFCSTHVCIPNYTNGTGTTVRCSDGSYSHSGGKQGACSHHGGVAHFARATAARTTTGQQAAQAAAAARLQAAQLAELQSARWGG
jgi:uncharacterized protein DUF3761